MALTTASRCTVLHACEQLVADAHDVPEVFQHLVDGARQLLNAPASWFATVDGDNMRIAAHSGRSPEMPARWSLKAGQGVAGAVAATGRPALLRDYRTDGRRGSDVKLIIDQEELRSCAVVPVCAPAGGVLGVLYVGDHEPGRITNDDVDLLALFASTAAVAVQRTRRSTALLRQSEARERAAGSLQRELVLLQQLATLLLTGADVQQALALLSGELNIGLELRDPLGRVVARAGGTGTPVIAEHLLATADVSLGAVTAHRDRDLDESGAQLLGAASGILALHLSRRRERYETEQRLHRQFLIDLLRPASDRHELAVRASLLGLDLESSRAVCCVGIHVGPKALLGRPPVLTRRALEVVEDAVGRHFPHSIVILAGAAAVILVPQTCPDRGVLVQGLRAALADATAMLNGMQLSAGLGAPCLSLDDYAGSYQDAALALELARGRQAGGTVLAREELGIYAMLARSLDPEGLRACILPALAPLLSSDEQRGSEHIRTLRVYLAHDRHLQRTADALHLHVNSLRYRLRRIEQLLAMDLHNPDDRFHLELAVRIADVLRLTQTGQPSRRPSG